MALPIGAYAGCAGLGYWRGLGVRVAYDVLLPLLGLSVLLLVAASVLVVQQKVGRGFAERRSARRRAAFAAALDGGCDRALVVVARSARRRRSAQDDLVVALREAACPERFAGPIRDAGLDRAILRRLGSRLAMRRARAAMLAGGIPAIDIGALAPLLRDSDPDVRSVAARAIAARRSPAAVEALVGCLPGGPIPPARIVEWLAGAWAAAPLRAALACDRHAAARAWIAEALGLAGDPLSRPALRSLLGDPDPEVRLRACRALGRVGSPEEAGDLVARLTDPDDRVRAQAARALAGIPTPNAAMALSLGLADPSWWVRANCADALRALGPLGIDTLGVCAERHWDRYARERASEALALETALALREAA